MKILMFLWKLWILSNCFTFTQKLRGPDFFTENGFYWISVRNQSFHQWDELNGVRWEILDALKSDPTISWQWAHYFATQERKRKSWGGEPVRTIKWRKTGPGNFFSDGALFGPKKLLPLHSVLHFIPVMSVRGIGGMNGPVALSKIMCSDSSVRGIPEFRVINCLDASFQSSA